MQTPPDAAPKTHRLAFLPLYLLFAGLCLAMSLLMLLDPSAGPLGAAAFLAMLLAAFALLVFLVTRPVAVAVGPVGVWPGNPKSRRCALVPWSAIGDVRPVRMLNLRFWKLRVAGRLDAVYLPLDLTDRAGFEADVLAHAPAGNPLRLLIEGGQAGQSPVPVAPAAQPLPEMAAAAEQATPDEAAIAQAQRRLAAANAVKAGANWFYWVAALSLVNTVAVLLGTEWSFVIGLGATQFVDGIAMGLAQELPRVGWVVQAMAVVLDMLIAGLFALAGLFARKRKRWAFIAGMALYGLDMVVLLLVQDWVAVGFHVLALWGMFTGLRSLGQKGVA